MTRLRALLALSLCLTPVVARGQMVMPPEASAAALRQVAEVRAATASRSTPALASSAGYGPVLNWLPTMGTHWINRTLQGDGKSVNLMAPDQLMFSPVNGTPTLVGAAYSYIVPLTDSTRPATFDGAPRWHDHPQFAPPGETLAMLHVWFVPSPDGPFAGHNPNLPFWALGLTPPPADRFMDPAESARIRKAALALGTVADTGGLFPTLAARPVLHERLAAEREAIRPLVAKLDAKDVRDWSAWDRAADEAAAHWDAVRAIYLGYVRTPAIRERLESIMDEMETGQHAHRH